MGYQYHTVQSAENNSVIMSNARAALKGNWAKAIFSNMAIPLICSGVICFVNIFHVAAIALLPPLDDLPFFVLLILVSLISAAAGVCSQIYNSFGMVHWFLNLVDRNAPGVGSSFAYAFRRYICCIFTIALGSLIVLGKFFLLIIPGILAYLDYAMVVYCLADDPTLGPCEALKRSRAIMRGHRWQLFCLGWRFFGWILLCVISCGIGFFWLFPYMVSAHAAFYRSIMPAKESEAYNDLPPTDGKELYSAKVNAILLALLVLVITLFYFTAEIVRELGPDEVLELLL